MSFLIDSAFDSYFFSVEALDFSPSLNTWLDHFVTDFHVSSDSEPNTPAGSRTNSPKSNASIVRSNGSDQKLAAESNATVLNGSNDNLAVRSNESIHELATETNATDRLERFMHDLATETNAAVRSEKFKHDLATETKAADRSERPDQDLATETKAIAIQSEKSVHNLATGSNATVGTESSLSITGIDGLCWK